MTVRQIMQEIETLPQAEKREVFVSLQEHLKDDVASTSGSVRYMSVETARPLIKEILTEHSELFRKLAQ